MTPAAAAPPAPPAPTESSAAGAAAPDTELAELAARLRLTVARVHRRARKEAILDGEDVSASRLAALATVERYGPLTLGELAAEEGVQPPSMTRIVTHLEQQGLVARTIDPDDRRIARVSITANGAELLRVTRTRRNAFLAQRIARCNTEERRSIAAALPLLERLLDD